jgi:hypothetical protein
MVEQGLFRILEVPDAQMPKYLFLAKLRERSQLSGTRFRRPGLGGLAPCPIR